MNVNLNFEKPTISAGVIELLLANMIEKADIDSLKIIAKGNKLLQRGPAIGLLISISRTHFQKKPPLVAPGQTMTKKAVKWIPRKFASSTPPINANLERIAESHIQKSASNSKNRG